MNFTEINNTALYSREQSKQSNRETCYLRYLFINHPFGWQNFKPDKTANMKNYCVSSKSVSLFLSLTLFAFLACLSVSAQQAIGVYPNIDAGFENQNVKARTDYQ